MINEIARVITLSHSNFPGTSGKPTKILKTDLNDYVNNLVENQ